MIIEKAYAKMFGSYKNIVGGHVDGALADLTGGIPQSFTLKESPCKEWQTTGVFWEKLIFWQSHNYLMGAGSPSGSDSDISSLGIVQGHAYSIMDATVIDGVKLIQLRNPWGGDVEWKGAWSDNSKEWTQKRKNAIY